MDIEYKSQIEAYFKDLDVDYSRFEGSMDQAESIASFICNHVKKDVPLELIPHGSTIVHHDLKIVGKEFVLVTFRSILGEYDVKNIYDDNNQRLVTIPYHDTYFYYIDQLVKNITFNKYLINEATDYHKVCQFTEPLFYKQLNMFSDCVDTVSYGILSIEDSCVVYRFYPYLIFVSIKINQNGTKFLFSCSQNVNSSTCSVQNFNTFHDLVCCINKYVYDTFVEPKINIPAHQFTLRHRELMKMIAI